MAARQEEAQRQSGGQAECQRACGAGRRAFLERAQEMAGDHVQQHARACRGERVDRRRVGLPGELPERGPSGEGRHAGQREASKGSLTGGKPGALQQDECRERLGKLVRDQGRKTCPGQVKRCDRDVDRPVAE